MEKIAPFKSQAQRRWMYANKPKMAKRWEKHTPEGADLPEKVSAFVVTPEIISEFVKIARGLKKLKPVPSAILEQQEAMQAAREKRKGISPLAARVAETARIS